MAESMASYGTAMGVGATSPDGEKFVAGLSNHTSFVRPAFGGDTVSAVATPRHRGSTTWVWEVECSDGQGRLCALIRVTIAVRDARPLTRRRPARAAADAVIGIRRSRPKARGVTRGPGGCCRRRASLRSTARAPARSRSRAPRRRPAASARRRARAPRRGSGRACRSRAACPRAGRTRARRSAPGEDRGGHEAPARLLVAVADERVDVRLEHVLDTAKPPAPPSSVVADPMAASDLVSALSRASRTCSQRRQDVPRTRACTCSSVRSGSRPANSGPSIAVKASTAGSIGTSRHSMPRLAARRRASACWSSVE